MQEKQRYKPFFGPMAEQDIANQCPDSQTPQPERAGREGQDIANQCPGIQAPANVSKPLINNETASCGSRGQQDIRTCRTSQPQVSAWGTAAEILATLADVGVKLRAADDNTLRASGPLTDELRQLIREHRAEILTELKTAKARAKVLADLRAHPGIRRAAEVDASGDPVQIMLGIRDVGTCILEIDARRWNLQQFIALLDRQAGLGTGVAA